MGHPFPELSIVKADEHALLYGLDNILQEAQWALLLSFEEEDIGKFLTPAIGIHQQEIVEEGVFVGKVILLQPPFFILEDHLHIEEVTEQAAVALEGLFTKAKLLALEASCIVFVVMYILQALFELLIGEPPALFVPF